MPDLYWSFVALFYQESAMVHGIFQGPGLAVFQCGDGDGVIGGEFVFDFLACGLGDDFGHFLTKYLFIVCQVVGQSDDGDIIRLLDGHVRKRIGRQSDKQQ